MGILITGGTVVSSRGECVEDVLIENGLVVAVGQNLSRRASDEVMDASGCLVMPGGIDAHTHMELKQMETVSSDTFESGSMAALCGGTTTIIDFANQVRGESLKNTIQRSLDQARGRTHCDYAFHVAVTDASDSSLADIPWLVNDLGVTSFKTFLAYDGLMLSHQEFEKVLHAVRDSAGLVTLHAELGAEIRENIAREISQGNTHPRFHAVAHSRYAESEATKIAVAMAHEARCPLYVVHVTQRDALEAIVAGKKLGWKVFAETCPQYLLLDESLYEHEFNESKKYVMSPPLRTQSDRDFLWKAVAENLIDVVATDHCPFFLAQKDAGRADFSKIPNGAPGIEERMALLYSEGVAKNKISLRQFREITSTRAAELFGLSHCKGDIAVGMHADIVIWDPNKSWRIDARKHHMNVDYSCYEGFAVKGKARDVVLRGILVVRNGEFSGLKPCGSYLLRRKFYDSKE